MISFLMTPLKIIQNIMFLQSGTVPGTVRALYGHCAGTVRALLKLAKHAMWQLGPSSAIVLKLLSGSLAMLYRVRPRGKTRCFAPQTKPEYPTPL